MLVRMPEPVNIYRDREFIQEYEHIRKCFCKGENHGVWTEPIGISLTETPGITSNWK